MGGFKIFHAFWKWFHLSLGIACVLLILWLIASTSGFCHLVDIHLPVPDEFVLHYQMEQEKELKREMESMKRDNECYSREKEDSRCKDSSAKERE